MRFAALRRRITGLGPRRDGWLARAEASAWELDPADIELLGVIDGLLAELGPEPEVLVVTDRDDERLALLVPSRQVVLAPVSSAQLRLRLATGPRPELVVLDVEDPERRRALVLPLAFLVPQGGPFVVARVRSPIDAPGDSTLRFVTRLLDRARGEAPPRGVRHDDIRHIRLAWRDVRLAGNCLVLRNGLTTYVTLTEREVGEVLARRPERGRVLTTLPAQTFEHRGKLRESEPQVADRWRRSYDVPDLSLRSYADAVCRPGGIVISGHTLMPDSHRHIARPRPNNRFVSTMTPTAARLWSKVPVERVLDEPHFYWDSEFRGHFGHVMTEMVSRLWALDEARRRHPGLKVLMTTNPNKEADLTGHELEILAAFGVAAGDVTFLREPARVSTLLTATPMFSQPEVVHPRLAEVWDVLGSRLAAGAPERPYPRRIFVSRRGGLRECRNAEEVESLFAAYGFEVVHPEHYPLAEQARMFREAEVIGGYAGSGLFNALMADTPRRLVLISSTNYTVENEWMIAGVRGHEVDIAWCRPEIGYDDVADRAEAFHAAYSVDFEREGVFLRQVLGAL